jgi:signal transduction histidine kinase
MTARLWSLVGHRITGLLSRMSAGHRALTRRVSSPSLALLGMHWRIVGRRLRSAQSAVVAATLASAGVTAFVALSPDAHFELRKPTLHSAIETTAAIIALIAAFLIAGRFERRRRLDDLMLAYALSLFAMTNFVFGVIPLVGGDGSSSEFATSAASNGRVLATTVFAAAAFAPPRGVRARWARATIVLAPSALLALTAAATAYVDTNLSPRLDAQLAQDGRDVQRLIADPIVLVGLLGLVALCIGAGLSFARRADREQNDLIGWLATASVFVAFARINDALSSPQSNAVQFDDGFRLLFYATILVAAAWEVRSYWSAAAELAVLEERRRIARDLHDGVAQEIAFIGRNLRRLDRDNPLVERLEAAGVRALEESRRAIAVLTEPLDRPLDIVLAEAAREVATREGGRVALSLARGASATPAEREVLVRIASEAITNAMRHGQARVVHLQLRVEGDRLRLRILDRGRGFDSRTVPPGRFGLVTMRERAEALGGEVRVRSVPGAGTDVEVIL